MPREGMAIDLTTDALDEIARDCGAIGNDALLAMQYAVADTAKVAKKTLTETLSSDLSISNDAIRRRIKVTAKRIRSRLANMGGKGPTGCVFVGLNPFDPIKDFSPGLSGGRRSGLSTGGRYALPGSFVGKSKISGATRVFHRKGAKRLPIARTMLKLEGESKPFIALDAAGLHAYFVERFAYHLHALLRHRTKP